MKLFSLLIFFVLAGIFKTTATVQKDSIPLAKKASNLLERSKSYGAFKAINTERLKNILQAYDSQLQATTIALENTKTSFENTQKERTHLKKTNQKLLAQITQKQNAKKYQILAYQAAILFLILIGLFILSKWFKQRSFLLEAAQKNKTLEKEYKDLQQNALKKQQVLARKLQDEILKNEKQ